METGRESERKKAQIVGKGKEGKGGRRKRNVKEA